MYSFLSKVRYSECDAHSKLSATALVNYLQDAMGFDCELSGRGFAHLRQRHLSWFVLGWHIIIDAPLSFLDDICIHTWTSGISSYSVRRSFAVEREDATVAVRASASLSLVDTTTGEAVRVDPEEAGKLEEGLPHDLGRMHLKIRGADKGTSRSEGERLVPITVNAGHLDLNNHVNNGQYVQMADDCLRQRHPELAPASVRVQYLTPAVLGDTIVPVLRDGELTHVIELCREADLKPFAIVEVTERP
jgi:acyl-CoA thioesterase FadM